MPAYVIAEIATTNLPLMDEYRKQVPATLAKYGGRYVVRGGPYEMLEGDWRPNRLVVIEFPTADHARRWYENEPGKGPNALRFKAGRTSAVLMEGA
jgi:uncharacterized protein (DUF1330 family)